VGVGLQERPYIKITGELVELAPLQPFQRARANLGSLGNLPDREPRAFPRHAQPISDMAHAKNELRKGDTDATADDHGKADEDHGVDGQEKADDANDDHGKPESDSDASDD